MQASGQVWGRWPEQHTHQIIYAMDISGRIQSYVPVHPFSGAPSTSMVVTHPQMHQNQFNFTPYTSAGQNGMVPASANNYIQQQPLPRLTQSDTTTSLVYTSNEVTFGTEVDNLMKAIQAKSKNTIPQITSFVDQSRPVDLQEEASQKGSKKRYQCTIGTCTQSFYQKTHFNTHLRAHTGEKPYPCKEPGCGRSFSQNGNLRTHERRHTGERPYACDICGKRFAQQGNIMAHMRLHNQPKSHLCRLDECNKLFTNLGNLKAHQNKFHSATIRTLTIKFASIKDGDIVNASEKELWEYFTNLYKNSNKGIKGRGKDRKVGVMGAYGAGRGKSGQYEMVGAESQSGHGGSGGASSIGTCDDDAPLAFGERIY